MQEGKKKATGTFSMLASAFKTNGIDLSGVGDFIRQS
jgi:hypothetical protein